MVCNLQLMILTMTRGQTTVLIIMLVMQDGGIKVALNAVLMDCPPLKMGIKVYIGVGLVNISKV